MPAKNAIRESAPDQYYHVYNRGVAKQPVFLDNDDRKHFFTLIARHLDPADTSVRADGHTYDKYDVELLCYCLMKNHFHMLLYQRDDPDAVTKFMRSLSTAYAMYFNKKYKRVGPIFQGRFKASRVDNDAYLSHISRYIHLNPRTYRTYKWSSLPEYLGRRKTPWLQPARILEISPRDYLAFLEEYENRRDELDQIKQALADK